LSIDLAVQAAPVELQFAERLQSIGAAAAIEANSWTHETQVAV